MSDLDPAHVEAVARALCPRRNGRVCPACHGTASRIVADPSALLAALVRAGVLEEGVQLGQRSRRFDRRRYVTEWGYVDE